MTITFYYLLYIRNLKKSIEYGKISQKECIMGTYYDGTKLLSMSDINGEKPELYLCTTNRTGGKTTYFSRLLVNKFLKEGQKFALLYRFNYELDGVADKFFKDIQQLFFSSYFMKSFRQANGIYHELALYDQYDVDCEAPKYCGYAISMNSADAIKRYSHLFSDVDRILFDEFQSETNHYCPREVEKFISVHTSIARGAGKQYRYVPVYMLSNAVSLINPYYTTMGISDRLNKDTKFLRGDGFVLEQGYIESAANAQRESAFNRALSKNKYVQYASQNVYLNDDLAFIEKPSSIGKYVCTISYEGVDYGIRKYSKEGIVYCDNHPDASFPFRIAVTTNDHKINYVMLKSNEDIIVVLRFYFERGCFRFKDLKSKEAVMKLVSYL